MSLLMEQNKSNYQYFNQQLESTRQTTAAPERDRQRNGDDDRIERRSKVSEYDEKGRWLRDLYMNAPSKEQATQVMQINMNGIGFSRDGFDGPIKMHGRLTAFF